MTMMTSRSRPKSWPFLHNLILVFLSTFHCVEDSTSKKVFKHILPMILVHFSLWFRLLFLLLLDSPYKGLKKEPPWKFNSRKRQRLALDTPDSATHSKRKPKAPRSWDKDGDDIPDFLEKLWDNSERESVGLGCLERIFGGGKSSVNDEKRNKLVISFWFWRYLDSSMYDLCIFLT